MLLVCLCVLLPLAKKLVLNLLLFFCRLRLPVRKEISQPKDASCESQVERETVADHKDECRTQECKTSERSSKDCEVPLLRKLPPRDIVLSNENSFQKVNASRKMNPYKNTFAPCSSVESQHESRVQYIPQTNQKQRPRDNTLSGGSLLPESRNFPHEIINQSCQSALAIQAVHSLLEICHRNDISTPQPMGNNYVHNNFSRGIPGIHSEVNNFSNGTDYDESSKKKRKLSCQSSLTVTAVFSLLEICSRIDISTSRTRVNPVRDNSSRAALTVHQAEMNIGNDATSHEPPRKRRRQSGTSDPTNGITKAASVLSSMKVTSPDRKGSTVKTSSKSNIENDDVYALLSLKDPANSSSINFDTLLDSRSYSSIVQHPFLTSH